MRIAIIEFKAIAGKEADVADFAWQRGYGAFSVSESVLEQVVAYVENQEEHHRNVSFQDEFRLFCAKHGVELDELNADGVSVEPWPGMDLTKRLGRLVLDGVRVGPEAVLATRGDAVFQRLADRATAALTAETIGAAARAERLAAPAISR